MSYQRLTRVLLDACTLVWIDSAPERLSEKARSVIEDRSMALLLSDATVAELTDLLSRRAIDLGVPVSEYVARLVEAYSLTPVECPALSENLPDLGRTPYARMLASQALDERIPIVTPDRRFKAYGAWTIW